jgi:hypothetical protein
MSIALNAIYSLSSFRLASSSNYSAVLTSSSLGELTVTVRSTRGLVLDLSALPRYVLYYLAVICMRPTSTFVYIGSEFLGGLYSLRIVVLFRR